MPLVVGVDMATGEVRAVALDSQGRLQAENHAPLPAPTEPRPGWSEQDARTWWPAVVRALAGLTERLGAAAQSVVAVSVCATSGTVVALDRHGEPLGPALMYSDQRAAPEAERAQSAAADHWASMGLRIRPTFGLAKWGWLLNQSSVASAVARLAHQPDMVTRRLVGGEAPTDWSHALKSGYDPQGRRWVAGALSALGIPSRLLPDVGRPTEAVGTLDREAALATGLPRSCEVRLGMTDACAAQLAAGAARPGRLVSVLGSTLVLKGASRTLVADPAGAVYSHRHPDGWWLPGGASSTGAGGLRAAFGDADLAALDRRAADHGPARAVVYPLVGRGERFPFAAADAEGFSLGDVSGETERYRATLEGVAFVERLGYERLRSLGAAVEPPLAVAGGGSRSRVWNTIRATALGMAVIETPDATTARGACLLAAAGTLHPDLPAATDAMAATGEVVEPDGETKAALDRNYERFVDALTARGWLGRRA